MVKWDRMNCNSYFKVSRHLIPPKQGTSLVQLITTAASDNALYHGSVEGVHN